MESGNPIALLGTDQGVVRFEDDTVSLLSSDGESVRCLARVPGGELLAGSDEGGVFHSSGCGVEWNRIGRLPRGVVSLVRIPGPRPRLVTLDRCGTVRQGSAEGGPFETCLEGLGEEGPIRPELLRLPSSTSHLVLVDPRRERLWRSVDGGASFAEHGEALPDVPTCLAVYPGDPRIWMLGLEQGLARSTDGGLSYQRLDRPGPLPVRRVALHRPSDPLALVVVQTPPGSEGASSLWIGQGKKLSPVPRSVLDSVRDPSGEILSATWARRNAHDVVLLGTDRGELLLVDPGRNRCELLTDGLGQVQTILAGSGGAPMDPEGSGIHLLP